MDMKIFLENRPLFPLDQLQTFAGRYVAWSADGRRIVASSTDLEELDRLVKGAGADPEQCVFEGIHAHDAFIGGGLLSEHS
jgi:hypothetical protein